MRFHTVAALYVLVFARFFSFTKTEYLIVLLTIGAVMALEAVNTSIEELCDRVTQNRDERIKRSKELQDAFSQKSLHGRHRQRMAVCPGYARG